MHPHPQRLFALAAVAAASSAGSPQSVRALLDSISDRRNTRAAPGRPLFDASGCSFRPHRRLPALARPLRRGPRIPAHNRSGAGANGVTHLRLEQVVDGLAVHGAYVRPANARGELVQVIDRLAAVTALTPNRVDALAALQAAMAQVHPGQAATFRRTGAQGNVNTFDGGTFFHSHPQ